MTWAEVRERIARHLPTGKVWGIPRGGKIVEGVVVSVSGCTPARSPEDADFFVDDIRDSGRTAKAWREKYGKPVHVLVDKLTHDADIGWVVFPWEVGSDEQGPEDGVVRLLQFIGEDVDRDGLVDTPKRVVKALGEMTAGYREDPQLILSRTFDVDHDEMVLLDGIRFTSLCEHHMLPFTGTASVCYVPGKKIVGISKLARLVECFARRLQVQERMTNQIADAMVEHLDPLGVGVVVRAHHECMGCRGVRQPGAVMVTSSIRGVLLDQPQTRAEFMSLIGGSP